MTVSLCVALLRLLNVSGGGCPHRGAARATLTASVFRRQALISTAGRLLLYPSGARREEEHRHHAESVLEALVGLGMACLPVSLSIALMRLCMRLALALRVGVRAPGPNTDWPVAAS